MPTRLSAERRKLAIVAGVGLSAMLFVLHAIRSDNSVTMFEHFPHASAVIPPQIEDCSCGDTSSDKPCYPWHVLNIVFSYDAARFVRDEVRRSWISRFPESSSRCARSNATRGTPTRGRILTLFVLGEPHAELASSVAAEAKEHGDMLFLHGDEGWDRGRTFAGYRAIFAKYNFDVLGKVDDDSFIHVLNLMRALDEASTHGDEWMWGMRCRVPATDFVCGEAFWMSRKVAEFLATSRTVDAFRIGAEDMQTTLAIRRGVSNGELLHFEELLVEGGSQFIDVIGAKPGSATMQRPFNVQENVCVHQVKTTNDWKRCRDYFFPSNMTMEVGDIGAVFVIRDVAGSSEGSSKGFAQMKKMLTRIGIPLPDEHVVIATSAKTLLGLCQAGKMRRVWDTRAEMNLVCRLLDNPTSNTTFSAVALRHTHTRMMQVIAESKMEKPVVVLDSRLDLDRDFVERLSDVLAAMPRGWDALCLAGCQTDQRDVKTSPVVPSSMQGFASAYVLSSWRTAEKLLAVLDTPDILVPMETDLSALSEFNAYTLATPVVCLPDPVVCNTPLRKSMLATA